MISIGNPSDDLLVRRVQSGDQEAFTQLYERFLPTVYNRVRYTVPECDVEDVTQEVFIAMMKSICGFRGEARFTTWLYTLTRRQVADYYRRRKPVDDTVELTQEADGEDMDEFPQTQAEMGRDTLDDRILLRQAIKHLPDNYQEVLLLRFAEGLQFNEIAVLQGITLEAAKSLFRRAVASLQRTLEESYA